MSLYKLGIKLFVANPAAVRLPDFIPMFHSWIQQQKIPGHQLIDVHDYSHVPDGPGILLVAHEGNFSLDQTGLEYYRKQPVIDPLPAAYASAQIAAGLLAVKFRDDEFLVFSNDRLNAPNTPAAHAQMEAIIQQAFPGATVTLAPQSADARERLAFLVKQP